MTPLAERLKYVRGGMTQKDFSKKINVSPSSYSLYEQGQRVPDADILNRICDLFNIEPGWLLAGRGEVHGKGEKYFSDSPGKCPTVGHLKKVDHSQLIENIKLETSEMSDGRKINAELLQTLRENADLLRQNGDLRVEVERLRMDIERRDARIAELERQLSEPQKLVAEVEADVAQLNIENRELREKVRQFERMGLRLHRESDALQNGLPGGDD